MKWIMWLYHLFSGSFLLQCSVLCNRSCHLLSSIHLVVNSIRQAGNLKGGWRSLAGADSNIDFNFLHQTLDFCLEHMPPLLTVPSIRFIDTTVKSLQNFINDSNSLDVTDFHHDCTDKSREDGSWSLNTVSYVLVQASDDWL